LAPVAPLYCLKTEDQAIRMANDTPALTLPQVRGREGEGAGLLFLQPRYRPHLARRRGPRIRHRRHQRGHHLAGEIAPFGGIKESGIDRWFDGENGISYVYRICIVEKPMQVQVARWGNSLGLRIPKDIALRAGLREGARVEVEAEGDRIIISPARPRYVLAELLKGMTPEAMREAFDWGPDKGREIVE
jgi:antitoxin MazE